MLKGWGAEFQRQALKAVSQELDGRGGGHRRNSLRYSYNAGSAGLVRGTGHPTRSWGVSFGVAMSGEPVSRGDSGRLCVRRTPREIAGKVRGKGGLGGCV